MFIWVSGGGILETVGVFLKCMGQKFPSLPEATSSLWHGPWAHSCADVNPKPHVYDRMSGSGGAGESHVSEILRV